MQSSAAHDGSAVWRSHGWFSSQTLPPRFKEPYMPVPYSLPCPPEAPCLFSVSVDFSTLLPGFDARYNCICGLMYPLCGQIYWDLSYGSEDGLCQKTFHICVRVFNPIVAEWNVWENVYSVILVDNSLIFRFFADFVFTCSTNNWRVG